MRPSVKTIYCPYHPDSVLNRINPELNSSHHAYCPVCLIKMEDGAALYKKFITLPLFINNIAASFAKHKEKIVASEQPEKTYLDVLAGRAESLSRLSLHLSEQKEEINKVYDELTSATLDELEKHRSRDLKALDQELEKMKGFYESLEETLNAAYPNKEDLENIFPSAEEIQKQIETADRPEQLQERLQAVKQNLSEIESWMEGGLYDEEKRRRMFQNFIQILKEEEKKRPQTIFQFSSMKLAKNEIANHLDKFFEPLFSLQNRLYSQIQVQKTPSFDSKLAKSQHFCTIKNWLPDSLNFNLKLLYRASEYGLQVSKFHELCDGKGSTLTLINCLFEGAEESTVIGGFLDKSWNSDEKGIRSEKSFLFSLTSKIKCPIIKRLDTYGAYGCKNYGPAFAGINKFEVVISKNLNDCFLEENFYQGTAKLANSKSWNGKGQIKFKVIDYEVFGFDTDSKKIFL